MSAKLGGTGRHGRVLVGFLMLLLGLTVNKHFETVWSWFSDTGATTLVTTLMLVVWAALLAGGVWLLATGILRGRVAQMKGRTAAANARVRKKIAGARKHAGGTIEWFEVEGLDPTVAGVLKQVFERFEKQQVINEKILDICETLLEHEMAAAQNLAHIQEKIASPAEVSLEPTPEPPPEPPPIEV
jgi:hypothetical protein